MLKELLKCMTKMVTHTVQTAIAHASTGSMTSKHCAVISKGHKTVALGVNATKDTYDSYSIHAEENAIQNLIKVA